MIKDSGERREFSTGSVRDMSAGKGRFDLMPMRELASVHEDDFFHYIANFMETGKAWCLQEAIQYIVSLYPTQYHAWLELAKHFENGSIKYAENNWMKGIPSKSYIDSTVRHYCKYKAGFDDEPHLTACLWNLVCCLWTINNKPELNSFPVEREEENE